MINIWRLFKINFLNSFSINKLKKRFSNKRSASNIYLPILIALIYLGFSALSFFYMMMFAMIFKESGNLDLILIIGIVMGVLLTFITTITKANVYLFASKDFDMLMSMPIKSSHVVVSKLLYLIFYNYIFFSMVYFPTIISYSIYATPNIIFWLLAILTFFVTPLLPIALCSFLSFFIGMLTAKLKHKNIILTIFLVLIFVFFMSFYFVSTFNPDPTTIYTNMAEMLLKVYPPADWATLGLVNSDMLNYLYFGLISVIPFVIFVAIVSKYFVKANTRANVSYTNKNYKQTELNETGHIKAILKKELRNYFSSSAYVINTIVGPLMSPLLLLFMSFNMSNFVPEGGVESINFIPLIVLGTSIFCFCITATTAASISLEGKNFWILKSSPVEAKTVFFAKTLIGIIVALPFSVINGILGIILFDFTFVDFIFYVIIIAAIIIGMCNIGLLMNLAFPKFDWDNPVKVIKSSKSVLMTMLIGYGILLIIAAFTIFIYIITSSLILTYLVITLIAVGFLVLATCLLFSTGVKRYNSLNA